MRYHRRWSGAVLVIAVVLSGCELVDRLTTVTSPTLVQANTIEQPGSAVTLLNGAVGDFECALGNYALFAGTMSDELQWSGAGSQAWEAVDARTSETSGFNAAYAIGTCSSPYQGDVPGVYVPLSTARYDADHLMQLLTGWTTAQVPQKTDIEATAAAYAGYSYVMMGEAMCSAAFDLGPAETSAQIFQLATDRFTQAQQLATQAADTDILTMALVGRARAQLDLGQPAPAEADAQRVPLAYVHTAGFSLTSPRRENPVYVSNIFTEEITVDASYRAFSDPRVGVVDQGRTSSAGLPIWHQTKYPDATTSIMIATGVEAELIVAESELTAGNLTAAVAAINIVRTRPGVNLAPFSSSDAAVIKAELVRERQAEFFVDGHRLYDIRRYNVPLDPPSGASFPLGGQYGSERCLPLPDVESQNNPNIGS
jgi:starch-binding outer membrane protein, SusD/RagB family